jgi:hypothetical protein
VKFSSADMSRSLSVLVSQLPVAECRRRLEAAAEPDAPIVADMRLKSGILASIDDNGFRLRVRRALIHNGISPRLSARFRPEPDSTLIELHFSTSAFWAVWASLVGVFAGVALGTSGTFPTPEWTIRLVGQRHDHLVLWRGPNWLGGREGQAAAKSNRLRNLSPKEHDEALTMLGAARP